MNHRSILGILALVALCACDNGASVAPNGSAVEATKPPVSIPVAQSPAPAASIARHDGYGNARFGMDETAFRNAWRAPLERAGPEGSTCFYLYPSTVAVPSDLAFMFEHGQFVRYDVGTDRVKAPGGGELGMRVEQIRALYPHAEQRTRKYVPQGSILRVTQTGSEHVLVFEVGADELVQRWRAGVTPQVDYVEGCS